MAVLEMTAWSFLLLFQSLFIVKDGLEILLSKKMEFFDYTDFYTQRGP